MNKLQKIILAILICMIGQICVAQDFANADIDATINSYTPTPQTWAFIRYGSIPVDHYTGKAMLTIPIYTYKDNDFELPISIGYVSEGFQPGRQTGILGLNWYLNCGGTISREIKGVADLLALGFKYAYSFSVDEKKIVYFLVPFQQPFPSVTPKWCSDRL